MPLAFITGATGQDGTYLTELLHEAGYDVHGLVRPGDPGPLHPEQIGRASCRERVSTIV